MPVTIEISQEALDKQAFQRAQHALLLAVQEDRLYPVDDPDTPGGIVFVYDPAAGDDDLRGEHADRLWGGEVQNLADRGLIQYDENFCPFLSDVGEERLEALNHIAECIGPRMVGGRYFCHYWGEPYTVLAIDRDPGPVGSIWTITECTDTEARTGSSRTHHTPWDTRDRVIQQPVYPDQD